MLTVISAADQRRERWKSKVKALPPQLAWRSAMVRQSNGIDGALEKVQGSSKVSGKSHLQLDNTQKRQKK